MSGEDAEIGLNAVGAASTSRATARLDRFRFLSRLARPLDESAEDRPHRGIADSAASYPHPDTVNYR